MKLVKPAQAEEQVDGPGLFSELLKKPTTLDQQDATTWDGPPPESAREYFTRMSETIYRPTLPEMFARMVDAQDPRHESAQNPWSIRRFLPKRKVRHLCGVCGRLECPFTDATDFQ